MDLMLGFGAGGERLELTYVAKAAENQGNTSTALVAGAQAGDLLLIENYAKNSSGTPVETVPLLDGAFTNLYTDNASPGGTADVRVTFSYRVLTAADVVAGTITNLMTSTVETLFQWLFRPNVPVEGIEVLFAANTGTSSNPAGYSGIAVASETRCVVIIGCYQSDGAVSPRTFTPAADQEVNDTVTSPTTRYSKMKLYNTAPQDTTIDMDDEGGENVLSALAVAVF
jgi:hypothetical protein